MEAFFLKHRYWLLGLATLLIGALALSDVYGRYQTQNAVELSRLRRIRSYSLSLLAREQEIKAAGADAVNRYAPLFSTTDMGRIMSELDAIAKAAGARVDMIRPVGDSGVSILIHGSWPQIMEFFRAAEGTQHLFEFQNAAVALRQAFSDLEVSATAVRRHVAQ